MAVLSFVVMAMAATLAVWATRATPAAAEVRLTIDTPGVSDPSDLASLAVSPDGLNVAFVAAEDGQPHVWVRPLDSVTSRPLPGTAGAYLPFWSADSRSVAFYADGSLKRIDLAGGLVRPLAKAIYGFGGAWNRDGTILLVQTPDSPILRTSADGAAPAPVTQLDVKQTSHAQPHFLPDGRHFLYFVQGNPEVRGVYLGELDGPATRKLFDADSAAVYTSGHVLFVRRARLFAQPFDVSRLETERSSVSDRGRCEWQPVGGRVRIGGEGVLGVPHGIGQRGKAVRLVRSNREKIIGTVGDADSEKLFPSASPDLAYAAFFGRVNGNVDIWVLETRRHVLAGLPIMSALTLVRSGLAMAVVSRSSRPGTVTAPCTRRARRAGATKSCCCRDRQPPTIGRPATTSCCMSRTTTCGRCRCADPIRKPFSVMQTEFEEREGKFSPDGRWLAYVSNSSGPSRSMSSRFQARGRRYSYRHTAVLRCDGARMAVNCSTSRWMESLWPSPLTCQRMGSP